jgi:hypothetical protein
MKRLVAIHQPNFFPWLGYFDKLARADTFVLLDSVQFPKTGGVWCNRVKMMLGGQARWATAPVQRAFHGTRAIREIEFEPGEPWRTKLVKSLHANYGRAPHFASTMEFLEPLVLDSENNLARYNAAAISAVASRLGLDIGKLRWSSALAAAGQRNQLLVGLVKEVGGGAYLCGGGADGYQDDALFAAEGIELVYQRFAHPVYAQPGVATFVPGLSIIDALMNCSLAAVSRWFAPAARLQEAC